MSLWSPDDTRVSVTGYAQDRNTSRTLPIRHVIDDIRAGKYRVKVEAIRHQYQQVLVDTGGDVGAAKKAVKPLKAQLPGIMWSGVFSRRGNGNLTTYSNLLCADLDHLEAQACERLLCQLAEDPYVLTAFISPTGSGVKAVFRVAGNADDHAANCLAVQKMVKKLYRCNVDESCKNLERLCFVSFDEHAFLNESVEALPTTPPTIRLHSASCISASSASCIPASSASSASHPHSILENIQARQSALVGLRKIHAGLDQLYTDIIEPRFQAIQGTRNTTTIKAVTFLYHAVAVSFVKPIVECFYDANRALFEDGREQHVKEAMSHLKAIMQTYTKALTPAERDVYEALPEQEQDAFRITRDLARLPEPKGRPANTFFLSYGHLGDRIGTHPQQAQRIMRRLQGYGLVKLVQNGTRRASGVRGDACTWRWMLP